MTSVASRSGRPKVGGYLSAVLEIGLSIGGYYLLRAVGVGVFWALMTPAVAVAAVVVTVTVRRRRIDLIGLAVLAEIAATITLSLVTQNPRVAALREVAYVFIAGVFCLLTLLYRTPLTHVSASSVATFGDPRREKAFDYAWRTVPRYRAWQRLLTASLGLIMIATTVIRALILFSTPDAQIAHAIDVSNALSLVMIVALVLTAVVLIQVPRKIIEKLAEQM
ncbi:MAG: hypothetical protein JOZ47_03335 [Kutzneria sp.]|nr:hypothetical protein [Kutzneria sp.]